MFRDSKEYQDIAKIYADKVSKPENLEEMTGGLGIQGVQKMQNKNKPKSREEVGLKPKPPIGGGGRVSRSSQNMSGKPKPIPTTKEIRAKDKAAGGTGMSNIPSKEGSAVIDGKKLNPNFGKKVDIKKEFPDKPEISKFTKQGKPRTKAQMMAAKRIASGKSISDVKQSNQDAMRARAKAKFEAFKKRREEKKAGMSEGVTAIPMVAGGIGKALGAAAAGIGAAGMMMKSKKKVDPMDFGKSKRSEEDKEQAKELKKRLGGGKRRMPSDIKSDKLNKLGNPTAKTKGKETDPKKKSSKGFGEEFTPYDIVLEYLLSSEQVATIEEANYVMTEMDAETIQAIVKEGSMMDAPDDVKAAGKRQYKAGTARETEPYTVDDKKTIINYYKNKKGQV